MLYHRPSLDQSQRPSETYYLQSHMIQLLMRDGLLLSLTSESKFYWLFSNDGLLIWSVRPPDYVPPRSSYPVGPPPIGSAYGSDPVGQIGVHFPREIVRIERDFSGGELVQYVLGSLTRNFLMLIIPRFFSVYPLELEGRVRRSFVDADIF